MDFLGTQWTAELYGCDAATLDDVGRISSLMLGAAEVAQATIVDSRFHHFSPYGVSGVVVIAESHLAIHTWPEHGYAALDVFSCGATLLADAAFRFLADRLGATHVDAVRQRRGAPHRISALSRPAAPPDRADRLAHDPQPIEVADQVYRIEGATDPAWLEALDGADADAAYDALLDRLVPVVERLWPWWRFERAQAPIVHRDRPGASARQGRGAGDVTVRVALPGGYSGGGTRFDRWGLTVGADGSESPGSILLFPSGLAHAHTDLPVTAGLRTTLCAGLVGATRGAP